MVYIAIATAENAIFPLNKAKYNYKYNAKNYFPPAKHNTNLRSAPQDIHFQSLKYANMLFKAGYLSLSYHSQSLFL